MKNNRIESAPGNLQSQHCFSLWTWTGGPAVTSKLIDRGNIESALSELLEMMRTPALLLDRQGFVLAANELVRRSFGNELKIVNERLVSPDPVVSAAVNKLVKCVASGDVQSSPLAVPIPRPSDLPIIVYGFQLTNLALRSFEPVRAILVPIDPRSRILPSESELKQAFDLSWMEARLALRLTRGDSLDAAAGACSVTYESARSLIKSAYRKTGTHRQAELVALVYSLALMPRLTNRKVELTSSCEVENIFEQDSR